MQALLARYKITSSVSAKPTAAAAATAAVPSPDRRQLAGAALTPDASAQHELRRSSRISSKRSAADEQCAAPLAELDFQVFEGSAVAAAAIQSTHGLSSALASMDWSEALVDDEPTDASDIDRVGDQQFGDSIEYGLQSADRSARRRTREPRLVAATLPPVFGSLERKPAESSGSASSNAVPVRESSLTALLRHAAASTSAAKLAQALPKRPSIAPTSGGGADDSIYQAINASYTRAAGRYSATGDDDSNNGDQDAAVDVGSSSTAISYSAFAAGATGPVAKGGIKRLLSATNTSVAPPVVVHRAPSSRAPLSNKPPATTTSNRALTNPKSPRFATGARTREHPKVGSIAAAKTPGQAVVANARSGSDSSVAGGRPQQPRQQLTVPRSPVFAAASRAAVHRSTADERPAQQQQSAPLAKTNSSSKPTVYRAAAPAALNPAKRAHVQRELTVPRSPAFLTKQRAVTRVLPPADDVDSAFRMMPNNDNVKLTFHRGAAPAASSAKALGHPYALRQSINRAGPYRPAPVVKRSAAAAPPPPKLTEVRPFTFMTDHRPPREPSWTPQPPPMPPGSRLAASAAPPSSGPRPLTTPKPFSFATDVRAEIRQQGPLDNDNDENDDGMDFALGAPLSAGYGSRSSVSYLSSSSMLVAPPVITYSTRPLTIPQGPNFATERRASLRGSVAP